MRTSMTTKGKRGNGNGNGIRTRMLVERDRRWCKDHTNVLCRLANKETRLSPPRVAVAVQQQQQGDGQGPQGRSPQIPTPNTYTHISAYPIPRPSSTSTVTSSSPRAHTCIPRWTRRQAHQMPLPNHIRLPQRRVGQPRRPCRAQQLVEVTLGQ